MTRSLPGLADRLETEQPVLDIPFRSTEGSETDLVIVPVRGSRIYIGCESNINVGAVVKEGKNAVAQSGLGIGGEPAVDVAGEPTDVSDPDDDAELEARVDVDVFAAGNGYSKRTAPGRSNGVPMMPADAE